MMNSDGTFKEDIQCIVEQKNSSGAIFISNIQAASNPLTLKKHNIGAVITAVKGKNLQSKIPPHIQYLYIPVVDHQSCNISLFFKDSFDFIEQQRKRTNVLVHCMAGVSRSVTLVIAYIMQKSGAPFQTVFNYVKSKRSIIHPNEAFVKQLLDLEKKLNAEKNQTKSKEINKITGKGNGQISGKCQNFDIKKENVENYKDTCESWGKKSSIRNVYMSKTDSEQSRGGRYESEWVQKQNKGYQKSLYDRKLRENIKKMFKQRECETTMKKTNQWMR